MVGMNGSYLPNKAPATIMTRTWLVVQLVVLGLQSSEQYGAISPQRLKVDNE